MELEADMALRFAFHLGSLAFATTLLRLALEGATFVNGLSESFYVGCLFSGIGFAVGEISRHMIEELAVRELAKAKKLQETGDTVAESSASSKS